MSNLAANFIADLSYPMGNPDLDESKWFQWRTVHMIKLGALDTYQFVSIGNGIRHASLEQERELITFLKRMEQYLIDHEALQAVGFRFVGGL